MKFYLHGKHHVFLFQKGFLIMKLTAFLIIAFVFQVRASGYAQKVTLSEKNVSLVKILKKIKKQSGYNFFYENRLLKYSRNMDINVKDKSLEEVLQLCLKDLPLTYTVTGKTIVIGKKENPLIGNLNSFQQFIITGHVKDLEGLPLPGVNIKLKGTKTGTVTSADGSYRLSLPDGNGILVYSFIGFENLEVNINKTSLLNVTLKQQSEGLNEVVVTALGIKRTDKSLTYNVQTLKGSDVTTVKDPSFVNSLNGKVAGATINASSSGLAGSTRVVLRGVKSITQNNNALYVVDGIPLPNLQTSQPGILFGGSDGGDGISNINPEDIESISILSGPAAAALYGYQAANGAIQVTTKKGSAEKTRINVTSTTTFSNPFVLPKRQDTYGTAANNAFASWGNRLDQPSAYSIRDFFQTGTNFSNSVSVSTGNTKNQTYFSAASVNAKGIIPNNKLSKYNLTARSTSSLLDDKLKLDISAMYLIQQQQNIPGQGQYGNPLLPLYLFPTSGNINDIKNFERYDINRNFNTQYWPYDDLGMQAQNPYWIINRQITVNKRERFLGSVAATYEFSKDLNLAARVKYDNSNDKFDSKFYASTSSFLTGGLNGSYNTGTSNPKQLYSDILLTFKKEISDFSITAIGGASLQDNKSSALSAGGALFTVPNFFSLSNISQNKIGASQTIQTHDQTQSIFFTGQAGYKQKLFLDVSGRNDWSSFLAGTNSKSIFYPSVGLSAIVSDIVKLPVAISFLKLRASYSEVGNPPAAYLPNPGYSIVGGYPTAITSQPFVGLKPERTASFETGLDIKFLKNSITFNATYYRANTSNQIFTVSVPPAVGFSSYYINAGKIQNQGIEATLGYNGKIGNVTWNPSVTFSLNRNKAVKLLDPYKDPFTGLLYSQDTIQVAGTGAYAMKIAKGGTTGDIYVQGLLKDAQGNLITDDKGLPRIDPKFRKAGSSNPNYNMGYNNTISYKNFSLGFLINARVGGIVISGTQSLMDAYGISPATASARDEGGVLVNGKRVPAKDYYGAVASAGGGSTGALGLYTYSATNVRLGELSLGYTIPGKVFNNKIQSISIGVIARNLWMIYNKAPFDPESVASTGSYYQGFDYFNPPSLRNVGFNIKVSL
ncbi:SusC/RagA family TonB-linked outer membrane protein [Pedobacter sp. PAMC26386]|nr:SusC/RagA family TonB-linked outer membrane protein [Pedobacter sp. PAMC26386]